MFLRQGAISYHCWGVGRVGSLTVLQMLGPTTGSCGRRGQRVMFPVTFVAGAAQPERYAEN